MKSFRRFSLLALPFLGCLPALSADDQSAAVKQPPTAQYQATVSKLRAAPKQKYEFAKALLGDVIRYVGGDAGIPMSQLPRESAEYDQAVTFSLEDSPFQVLESLCQANALTLVLDNGTWYVRPADDRQQVERDYEPATDRTAPAAKNNSTPAIIGSGLTSRHDEITADLRSILDLPPANISGAPPDSTTAPKVSWKPNSDTLHVVATRLQQLWVQAYLSTYKKGWKVVSKENSSQEISANSR